MEKKKFRLPDAYVLLFFLAAVFAILTYIIPAGEYTRYFDEALNRTVVDPTSFHYVEQNPIGLFQFFESVFASFSKMGDMIFFTLIISGAFQIIRSTGALDAGIASLAKALRGKEKFAIPLLVAVFSLFGSIMGSAEELLPFYPIVISLAISLGFDSVTGVAIILCGAGAGFAGAMLNPFTIGVAHGIAGLPAFSGLGYRVIINIIFVTVTAIYIYRYAIRVHKDPTKSLMYGEDVSDLGTIPEDSIEFTTRHKLVILVFILGVAWMAYGVVKCGFYFQQLSAVFLVVGVVVGIVGKLGMDGTAAAFVKGMSEMVYGAFLIGVAGTVGVVMETGMIQDTIIHALASLIQGLAPAVSAVMMFFVQSLINFFVPSGSGQATVSMPIMAPLADLVGLTRQTAVLCFQFGDGLSNMLYPTVGYMMAAIALGKVKYGTWVKFIWKLFVILSVLAAAFCVGAVMMNYGPF